MILRSYRKQTIILLLPLLANCSTFYLQRYQERKQRSDLDRSIEFAQETLQDMEDNSPKVLEYIDHLGFVLGLRYNSTYSMEDLATMELAWQRALANSPDGKAQVAEQGEDQEGALDAWCQVFGEDFRRLSQ